MLTSPEQLSEWAQWTREAIKTFHGQSPAHQARSDMDSQYGNEHPNMTEIPMPDMYDGPGPHGEG